MTHHDANPATIPTERIALLDALRGFALLGILFVNMTWFTGFAVLSPDQRAELSTAPADTVTAWLIYFFVDGKFWSLFALLFGAGAALHWARAQARGDDCTRLFLRRLIALIFIGLLHAVFLWFGDIISLYAVVGLAMLLFRRCSDRALLVWATLCLMIPILQGGLWLIADRAFHASTAPAINPGHGPAQLLVFFGKGTYAQAFLANWAFLKERWFLALYQGRFFKLLGMFLLGYWAARRGIFHRPSHHRQLLTRVLTWGLLIAVPANVIWAQLAETVPLRPPSLAAWLLTAVKTLGVPALSLAYVAAVTLLFDRLTRRRGLAIFISPGRMSLTNYVLQSVVGITLFYGYGLGYWGRVGPTLSIPLIAVIFGAQVQFSTWWLRRFRYGPLAWAWRCVTYWRCLPLRHPIAPPPSEAAALSSMT